MLCENCKKTNATFHYKYNDNGNVYEAHLCGDCAKKSEHLNSLKFENSGLFSSNGILDELFGFNNDLSILSGTIIGPSTVSSKVCPSCGMSESELRRTGKLGCDHCYKTFDGIVRTMLEKLQLSCEYKGSVPEKIIASQSVSKKIESLREQLKVAVEKQEYEEAAKLRDSIRQLESATKE